MNKLFIDTNIFEKSRFNFTDDNPVIFLLIKNIKQGEYEYYNLSIFDKEIIKHISEECSKEFLELRKRTWLFNYIDEDTMKKKCYKKLTDYEQFKKDVKAVDCDVSAVNPEDVFQKYFNVEYPFENKDDKKSEFPDAFASAYVNNIMVNNNEKTYFVTNDNGLRKSFKEEIITYNSIEEFLSEFNNVLPYQYKKIQTFIYDNIDSIAKELRKKIFLDSFLEDFEFELDDIKINNISDINIIGMDGDNKYFVNCKCDELVLTGDFSCLDYSNSYLPNDCDYYIVQKYVRASMLSIHNYEFMIEINVEDDSFYFSYLEHYYVTVTYKDMLEAECECFDYDGEDDRLLYR